MRRLSRRCTLVVVAISAAVAIAGASAAGPSSSAPSLAGKNAPSLAGKKKCTFVIKIVHGKKHKVRVCHTIKPPPPPPPLPPQVETQMVDVGGYRLYIECTGSGSPTVILIHGSNDDHLRWHLVEPDVGTTTRVCAYDRAGDGKSDARPAGRYPASRVVDELHALLTNGHIPGPYVLAGHSIGGFYARLYTKHYPGDVAGLVLLDGVPEQWLALWLAAEQEAGLDEGADFPDAIQELTGFSTGPRPLVVLVQGAGVLSVGTFAGWEAGQKSVAQRSTNAWFVRVTSVGHNIAEGNPRLVVESIRAVVTAVRSSTALPACASSAIPAARGECLDPNAR